MDAEQTPNMKFKPNPARLLVSHTGSFALAGGSGDLGGVAAAWLLEGFLGFGRVAGAEACAGLETLGLGFSRDFCRFCSSCCCCWEMLMA